ncbi:MAG: (d)CMP kinase [Corynebacteriales bacterium]|nr:(d)CMP kinase [Mycobacteriales bacterium]
MIIAIDGPSGSGKSTTSRRVASALGAQYLDTGAMYRALTWAVLDTGVAPADAAELLHKVEIQSGTDPSAPTIAVSGRGVDVEIRGDDVTSNVSAVAAVPAVRQALVAQQRRIISEAGEHIVVEGRDIGTVVAPKADLKVFLTASQNARAERRSAELAAGTVQDTQEKLAQRDALDSGRATDPLRAAQDAVIVDSTAMNIDEVVAHVLALAAAAQERK